MKDVLCVILGGGRGTRLYPLTKYRSKPAVPIAGKYRLIDIPISNCLNSDLNRISILTQFNSESLNRHIARAYKLDYFSGGFVEIIAAEQSLDHADWFQGSADAVRKSFKHLNDPRFKYILILSGDQLYKMDFNELVRFHIEKGAEITVACNAVSRDDTHDLGIMGVNKDMRIREFVEKPSRSADISKFQIKIEGRERFMASMGIYLFNKNVLFDLLLDTKKVDFGREIIPEAIKRNLTYGFVHEGYWRDIGSIKAFYEENLAFTHPAPPLDLYDENWPFFTRPRYLPLSRISKSGIENTIIAEGATIEADRIARSIVGLRARIGKGSIVEDSILLGNDYYHNPVNSIGKAHVPGIGKNCLVRKAIIDKNVKMGDNCRILNERGLTEFENEHCVIRSGVIIIPKNTVIPGGTVI
ncbi:MAG: glucose-1-phosphate adenylyltransferase [Deltaproteobacteria bacterium]